MKALLFLAALSAITAPIESETETVVSKTESSEVIEASSTEVVEYECKVNISSSYYAEKDDTMTLHALENSEANPIYTLSKDGWVEGDIEPIVLNIREVFAPIETSDKYIYAYVYKVSSVTWADAKIDPIEGYDNCYSLDRPIENGSYNLSIVFAKTLFSYKDITTIDFSSLFTLENLITLIGWVAIMLIIIVGLFVINKLKNGNGITLASVKNTLVSTIKAVCGVEVANTVSKAFDEVVKESYNSINKSISTIDENVAALCRCIMLIAEGSAESRAAALKELSNLQKYDDQLAEKLLGMINEKQAKIEADKAEKERILQEAKEENKAYLVEDATETERVEDDGTTI